MSAFRQREIQVLLFFCMMESFNVDFHKKVVVVSKSRALLWKDAIREIQLQPQKLLINLYNGLTELHLNSAAMF